MTGRVYRCHPLSLTIHLKDDRVTPELADTLVRWTARLVVVCYLGRCWVEMTRVGHAHREQRDSFARVLWTIGLMLFVVHVAAALVWVHGGSHAAAYEHTAERTAAVVGLRWGGGIYVNHLFLLFWLFDVAGWWFKGHRWAYGSNHWYWTVQAVFAFMFMNATVVFGPGHWLFITPLVLVVALLARLRMRRT